MKLSLNVDHGSINRVTCKILIWIKTQLKAKSPKYVGITYDKIHLDNNLPIKLSENFS